MPAAPEAGLLRVTVTTHARRVDLVVPSAVPVAELVPELARCVGLLEAATVHGGYRLVTLDGRVLSADAGLGAQGVGDGGLITLTAVAGEPSPPIYDDVVDAMTDVAERDLATWLPEDGRRTAIGAAGLLFALGGVAFLVQPGSTVLVTAAAAMAVALVAVGILLSRCLDAPEAALLLAWLATGYAAVAGMLSSLRADRLADLTGGLLGEPVAAAGGAALLTGAVGLVGLRDGRTLVIPPIVVGAMLLATGLANDRLGLDAAVLPTCALVLAVLAASVFPWLAIAVMRIDADPFMAVGDVTAGVDPVQLAEDARMAHQLLVAVSAGVGLLLVLVVPVAVSLGISGTMVSLACCLVVMLRTRQYRSRREVLVGLVSGTVGLLSAGGAALWLHPGWRPAVAAALAAVGAGLLVATLAPTRPSVRRGWLGDVAETAALVALLPLLVIATGLLDAVRA